MLRGKFDIPTIYFFEEKNIWTGSRSQTFNYKIQPEEKLKVSVWYGLLCFDKALEADLIVTVKEFDKTEDGVNQIAEWLEESFAEYEKNYTAK